SRALAEIARGEQAERSHARRVDDLDLRLARIREESGRLGGRDAELRDQVDDLSGALDGLRRNHVEVAERTTMLKARPAVVEGELPEGARGRMLDLVRCEEEYRPIAEALLGDVLIVEDLLGAVDLWRAGCPHRLVTVDGEIVDARGVISGGSRDA